MEKRMTDDRWREKYYDKVEELVKVEKERDDLRVALERVQPSLHYAYEDTCDRYYQNVLDDLQTTLKKYSK